MFWVLGFQWILKCILGAFTLVFKTVWIRSLGMDFKSRSTDGTEFRTGWQRPAHSKVSSKIFWAQFSCRRQISSIDFCVGTHPKMWFVTLLINPLARTNESVRDGVKGRKTNAKEENKRPWMKHCGKQSEENVRLYGISEQNLFKLCQEHPHVSVLLTLFPVCNIISLKRQNVWRETVSSLQQPDEQNRLNRQQLLVLYFNNSNKQTRLRNVYMTAVIVW